MSPQDERQRVTDLLFYAAVVLLAYLTYRLFQPFLAPLCWAGVLVVCFYPMHARFERKWGLGWAAAVSTIIVTLALVMPGLLVTTAFVREAAQAITNLVTAVESGQLARLERVGAWIEVNILGHPATTLPSLLREIAARTTGSVTEQAAAMLRNVAVFILSFITMVFAVFFFFRDAPIIIDILRRLLPFEKSRRERILTQARDLIFASVVAGLIVAAIQGLLGGAAFAVLGFGEPVFWGVMMGFFSLLPVIGAWVIWAPAAIWLAMTGHVVQAVVLAGFGAVVVGLVDNFLRPVLLSGRAELNGLLIFIGLLGGVAVFGFLGLVLGPIILATVATLFDTYTRERRTAPRQP
jgi:predicted PurR-regulated permease PerM